MKTAAVHTLLVIAAQLIALLLTLFFEAEMPTMPEARLLLQGFIASLVGRLLRQPYWLVPVNLLLPLAIGFVGSQLTLS